MARRNAEDKSHIAYKYRVYPSAEQAELFHKTFGCCRKVWNLMLSDKVESYKEIGKFVSVTPAMYKDKYPFLREVDSLALANKQMDLQQAFQNCFDKKRKKKNQFPKFKSAKKSRKSYTTNNVNGNIVLGEKYIRLPKVGNVKAVIHRLPEEHWVIKSVTVSMERDGSYYVSILFEFDKPELKYMVNPNNAIGLDYASDGLYVDSNGEKGSNHKYYRESQKKLAKEQKRLARKVGSRKGEEKSNNWMKQNQKVNKIHRHIANQRKDHLHKTSTEIANQYDVICVENLNMKTMANKGFKNGKATMDNGYGMFLNMLEYKLNARGKQLVKIDKWYPSSQLCHCCGKRHLEMKDLQIRMMQCGCGLTINRDHNAAINILQEGLRLLSEVA